MSRRKSKAEPRQPYTIRLGRVEREKLLERAADFDMSPSEYLRSLALSGGIYDPYRSEERKLLLSELSRIGNNINQIAKWANTNKEIPASYMDEVWKLLKEIYEKTVTFLEE